MQRNRYFKSTFGTSGEFLLANTLDNSATPVDPVNPTSATALVTVAASPAAGDIVNITINGQVYSYVVKAGDSTAATLVASIVTDLNLNNVGFVASVAGTTSATFTIAAPPNSGVTWNGRIVSIAAGATNVSTFSAFSSTNFGTNGVDGVEAGPQPTIDLFVANAPANSLGVYWEDTRQVVAPGATGVYANRLRKFIYAWKTASGNTMITTGVTAGTREYRTTPYFAGQVDIWTLTFTGTYTAGQILHVRVMDITAVQIPSPTWEWVVVSTGTIATDLDNLAALINGEQQEPVVSAVNSGGGVLTITGLYNSRLIRVGYYMETIGQPGTNIGTDQSVCAFAQTQKSIAEVGTTADVTYFEEFFKTQNGIMNYVGTGTYTPAEFNNYLTSVVAGTQYGFLIVKSQKESIHKSSVLSLKNNHFIMIAIVNTSLTRLAGY